MQKLKNKKNGFSLVELLVVIAIMAILMSILVMNFVGARERARDAKKIQDLNSLKNALRLYYNDNQAYPICSGSTSCLNGSSAIGNTSYLPSVSQIGYTYTSSDGEKFVLSVPLESGAGNDDINSQMGCGYTNGTGVGATVDKVYMVCN